jgi:hypothetical protein
MGANDSFYKKVVGVTYEYLGPSAGRFVGRQVRNHLNKEPECLCKQDLAGLIDWVSLAMAILIEDENLVNKYVADLKGLTHNGR